jgi:CheY-like chemotaxis protein
MTAARIIEALGSLLWPLLLAVVVWRVAPHLPGLLGDLRGALRTRAFKVKVGGAELSVEEATEQLRRQVTDLQTQMAAQLAERGPPRAPGAAAAPGAAPQAWVGDDRPTVLWVDDRPEANALELAKLRDDGVEVLQAKSTAEAMDVLALRRGVQAIVTDLGRVEGGDYRPHAGLELLKQLREAGLPQPVLVYTSARGSPATATTRSPPAPRPRPPPRPSCSPPSRSCSAPPPPSRHPPATTAPTAPPVPSKTTPATSRSRGRSAARWSPATCASRARPGWECRWSRCEGAYFSARAGALRWLATHLACSCESSASVRVASRLRRSSPA